MVYDILWRDFRSRGNLPLILKKVQSSHISEGEFHIVSKHFFITLGASFISRH